MNKRLSVIIRVHEFSRLALFEEAIFSLVIQKYSEIEPVVVVQNGTKDVIRDIRRILKDQPWAQDVRSQVLSVNIPSGEDGRSRLMNEGIRRGTGRYLAFLDYDDVIYQGAYTELIGKLRGGQASVAVGGCRFARLEGTPSDYYIKSKENRFAWGRSKLDLFKDNFVPVNSFVLDRARIPSSELQFPEHLSHNEDYYFLLCLAARWKFDFSLTRRPLCEYRVRSDGSNTILYGKKNPSRKEIAAWRDSERKIRVLKRSLLFLWPLLPEEKPANG